jgi:hypothetical protein
MRVLFGFRLGVVLAMHSRPLLGDHSRGEPQKKPEKVTQDRVQVK